MLDEGEGGGDFLMSHVDDMDVDVPGQRIEERDRNLAKETSSSIKVM